MKKILFLGTHGQANWGDEILLEVFLSMLGKENHYLVNSYDPQGTLQKHAEKFDLETFHTTKDILKLPGKILKSDLLFFGGGSILKELYVSIGRNKYSTLLMILGMVTFARQLGRKQIIMSNIGIGKVSTGLGKFLVKLILSQVDLATFRDAESYQKALDVGISKNKILQVPDAVFAKEPAPEDKQQSLQHKPHLTVGLNLNFDIANPDNWDYFLDKLSLSLAKLNLKYDLKLIGIPMQTGFNPHNDVVILEKFQKLIPDIDFEIHVPRYTDELQEIIASCDILIAERLHTLVFCAIQNRPFVGLKYDVKVDSLISLLGMQDYAVDINSKFEEDEIDKKFELLIKDYQKAQEILQDRYSKLHQEDLEYFAQVRELINQPKSPFSLKKWLGGVFKSITKSPLTYVFLFAVAMNLFIFRGVIADYPNILAGKSTLASEEMVPIFDFQTQYLDQQSQPYSELTSNFEFRIRYSWLSTWTRYYLVLPWALVLLNAVSLTLIFAAIYNLTKDYFKPRFAKLVDDDYVDIKIFFGALAASMLCYFLQIYNKITHYYTLVFGFAIFSLTISLTILLFLNFKVNTTKKRLSKVFWICILTIINPATHYVILALFMYGLLGVAGVALFIKDLFMRSKQATASFIRVVLLGIIVIFSLGGYLLYYLTYITSNDSFNVTDYVGVTRTIVRDASFSFNKIFALQTGSILDFFHFTTYNLNPDWSRSLNYFYSASFLIILLAAIYSFWRNRKKHDVIHSAYFENQLILAVLLFFLGAVAVFFALGYSYPISAHNTAASVLSYLDSNPNPISNLAIQGITTFFTILRFPHRFLFIYQLLVAISSSILFVYIVDVLFLGVHKLAGAKSLFHYRFALLILTTVIFLVPYFTGKAVAKTLLSGNYDGFFATYQIPSDLKEIKQYLAQNRGGRMIVLPSTEVPYRFTKDGEGDSFKLIDKFFIYYLNYPSLYYGLSSDPAYKNDFYLVYQNALDSRPWFNFIRNKNIEYILVNKKQYRLPSRSYRDDLEPNLNKEFDLLEAEGLVKTVVEADNFKLLRLKPEFVGEKQDLYLNDDWQYTEDLVFRQRLSLNDYSIKNIDDRICDAKDKFSVLGGKDKTLLDLLALCEKSTIKYNNSLSPFRGDTVSTDDYINTVFSMATLKDQPGVNQFNRTDSINPGTYGSLAHGMIFVNDNNTVLNFNFNTDSSDTFNFDLRAKTIKSAIRVNVYDTNDRNIYQKDIYLNDQINYFDTNSDAVLNDFSYANLISNLKLEKGKYTLSIQKLDDSPLAIDSVVKYTSQSLTNLKNSFVITQTGDNLYQFEKKK